MNNQKRLEFLGRKVEQMFEKYHKDHRQLIVAGHKDKITLLSSQLSERIKPFIEEIAEITIKNEQRKPK